MSVPSCFDCAVPLGPVLGTVASCPSCKRAYVVVTPEERAINQEAMKKKK